MANIKRLFTEDDAYNLFSEALHVVERLDPPEDLRVPCFSGVVSMLGQAEMSPSVLSTLPFPQSRIQ